MPSERPSWAPQDIDVDKPNAARIYDYFLGGGCNFAHDREFADKYLEVQPNVDKSMRVNRAFLGRAVRFCVEQGIRQFLDIGSGIPTVGNVHEIAQAMAPECRVVYVDNEPIAVAHSEAILAGNDHAAVLQADLRDPGTILNSQSVKRLIDFDQPLALLMVAVLHFVPESDDPGLAIARYLERMTRGSYFVVSHGTTEGVDDMPPGTDTHYDRTTTPFISRTRHQLMNLMAGTQLEEPGLVWASQWRPESPQDIGDHPETMGILAAVAHTP
jgi:hypothetical protein